ncbi:MAG: argininosuccinate lyase [Candidatus Omnitrophota bacterium]
MSQLWGGRFEKKGIKADVMKFTSSLDVDKVLVEYDCLSSKTHVEMLSRCGFVTEKEKEEILTVLDDLLLKMRGGLIDLDGYEDIHSAVQDYVEKNAPIAAKKMHTARSRNEQVVNDVRLYCKDKIKEVKLLTLLFQKELVELADKVRTVVIPGYTHLNHAQPILFSHLVMAYVEMFQRDIGRLEDSIKRCDISVMGSGALAGSSLKLDRKFSAEKMGFKDISANSIDSVSDRDFVIEFVSCLSLIAMHLSRIAEDFILYSIPEFGFLEIGEDYCTGSSLMPQKKNPDVLELVRGKTSHVIGSVNALFVLMKGQPHSYNRDMQEDKKHLFESVELVSSELEIMAGLVKTIILKEDNIRGMLKDEFIYATDLAEYLVVKGVAFSDAHKIIGSIVKHCVDKNMNISDLSISEMKGFSTHLEEDVYRLLNAEASVKNKKTLGSTNPKLVRKEIAKWKKRLGKVKNA